MIFHLKDDGHVGVGVWPFIIDDPIMLPAAEWHDQAYTKGSWHQQNMTRKEVDEWFLSLMLTCASTAWQRARAHVYYGVVRALGRFWWEGKE